MPHATILVVSPQGRIADEGRDRDRVRTLGRGSAAADLARAVWSQAQTCQIKRMEPIWTAPRQANALTLGPTWKDAEHPI